MDGSAVAEDVRSDGTAIDVKYEDDFETDSTVSNRSNDLTEVSSTSLSTNTLHLRLRCYGFPVICANHGQWFDLRSRGCFQIAAQTAVCRCACPVDVPLKKNRVNMSFSNDEMRKIVRENEILLKKIMAHSGSTKKVEAIEPTRLKPSAYVNRMRQQQKINRENSILLQKIKKAKPSLVSQH